MPETTTTTTTPQRESLRELRRQHEAARLALETDHYQAARRLIRQTFLESGPGWNDWVDPREYLYDDPRYGQLYRSSTSQPEHRQRGQNYPVFTTLEELAQIRGQARHLSETNEIARGVLLNLTNYVIGTGFKYTLTPRDDRATLAEFAQRLLEEFFEANDWSGDLERELFRRAHRDGEWFLRYFSLRDGTVALRVIEPELIVEPERPALASDALGELSLDWGFGIGADHRDVQSVYGYHVQWPGSQADWEVIPAGDLEHCKVGVDRNIKRGLSDLYAARPELERIDKLLRNIGDGAALQAAIAFIREHTPGATQAGVSTTIGGKSDYKIQQTMPSGRTRTTHFHQYDPGSILDIPSGTKYHPGPMGSPQGPALVPIVQAIARQIATGWAMPEYMISGDASNANYSSTLVAEAPFVKAAQVEQHFAKTKYARMCWRALGIMAQNGLFSRHGISSLSELKSAVKLAIDPPQIQVRNPAEEESIRQIRHQAGVLSRQTWASQVDLDWDQEQANLKAAPPSGTEAPSGPFQEHRTRNNPEHHKRGAAPRIRVPQQTPSARAQAAIASHKPAAREKQLHARQRQTEVMRGVGGTETGDNKPMDVIVKIGAREHGIEVKTLLDNRNNKVTMHPDSRRRKEAWSKEQKGRRLHTVVIDERNTFSGGKNKAQYSGHRIYYREGVGAFRLGQMRRVGSMAELKRIIGGAR